MKKLLPLSLIISTLCLSGCNDNTPNCSAKETIDLLIEIMDDEAIKKTGHETINKAMGEVFKSRFGISDGYGLIKINNIQTIKHNKENDSYLCKANMIDTNEFVKAMEEATQKLGKGFDENKRKRTLALLKDINITYTIESTGNKNEFYIRIIDGI